MKIIKKPKIKHFIDVAPLVCRGRIIRYGLDRYAVISGKQPVFAFESEEFSFILHSLESPIIDFEILETKDLVRHDEDPRMLIKLELGEGDIISLDQSGTTEYGYGMELVEIESRPTLFPWQVWADVPKAYPFNRLVLTNELIRQLEMNPPNLAKVILARMWKDFKMIGGGPPIETIKTIYSEFITFSVSELPCGRLLCMAESETQDVKFPNVFPQIDEDEEN